MYQECREFVRGAWALGAFWRGWMVLLMVANGVAPAFFLPQLTAVVTLVATFTAVILALVLIRVQGRYTKLLGIIHAPWIPMLAVSIYLFPWEAEFDRYKTWLTFSIAMTMGSLLIDATDVVRFLKSKPALSRDSD